jgi:membrane protein implicated in regulation of membrane protease activity
MAVSKSSVRRALFRERGSPSDDLVLAVFFWLPFTLGAVVALPWFLGAVAIVVQVLLVVAYVWEWQRMRKPRAQRKRQRAHLMGR